MKLHNSLDAIDPLPKLSDRGERVYLDPSQKGERIWRQTITYRYRLGDDKPLSTYFVAGVIECTSL